MNRWQHDPSDWVSDIAPARTKGVAHRRGTTASGVVVAVGVALAGLAALNRILANQAEKQNPPRGHFVTVQGQRLHYLDEGEGPVVLLLHGNGSMSEDFVCAGLIERLSKSFRVIAFDRPGFGHSPPRQNSAPQSQADLIADALVSLGVTEAIVLGHSWGTLVATALAGGPKVHVTGLVLISGYYLASHRLELIFGSLAAIPVVGQLLSHTVLPYLVRANWNVMVRSLFAPQPADSFAAFPSEMTFRPSQLYASARETALLNQSVKGFKRLRALDLALTVIAGGDDRIVDPVHSARLAHEIPSARLEVIPGQGHMVHHTSADQIVGAITRMQQEHIQQQESRDVDRR